jgi:hypothetical protein
MSSYSKGTFTHQSLRIEKSTLNRLQKLRQDKGIYMAKFASSAIDAAIDQYYENFDQHAESLIQISKIKECK